MLDYNEYNKDYKMYNVFLVINKTIINFDAICGLFKKPVKSFINIMIWLNI